METYSRSWKTTSQVRREEAVWSDDLEWISLICRVTSLVSVALRLSQEQEAARQRSLEDQEEEIMRQVLELSLREK